MSVHSIGENQFGTGGSGAFPEICAGGLGVVGCRVSGFGVWGPVDFGGVLGTECAFLDPSRSLLMPHVWFPPLLPLISCHFWSLFVE